MTTTVQQPGTAGGPIPALHLIDCDIHQAVTPNQDLFPYLPRQYAEYITDFGSGEFERRGLLLFTIRNGRLGDPAALKPYAEKIMIVRERQLTPMHFHFHKMEDIINRGGGRLVIELWGSDEREEQAAGEVQVSVDGVVRTVPGGGRVVLEPGQSITLPPRLYHAFWGDDGGGTVLVGEVSSVNDDATDNRFLEPVGRFPDIVEDESPRHLLCTEYPPHLQA